MTGCGTHLEASHTAGAYVVDSTCVTWGWDVGAGGRTAEEAPAAAGASHKGKQASCEAQ